MNKPSINHRLIQYNESLLCKIHLQLQLVPQEIKSTYVHSKYNQNEQTQLNNLQNPCLEP